MNVNDYREEFSTGEDQWTGCRRYGIIEQPDSSYGTSHEDRKEDSSMSFLYLMTLHDGAILATDSRLTITTNGSISEYKDDTQKIFPIQGTGIVVAMTGQMEQSVRRIPMKSIIEKVKSRTRYEIAHELRQELRLYAPSNQVDIVIAECVKDPEFLEIPTYVLSLRHEIKNPPDVWHLSEETLSHGSDYFSGARWALEYAKGARIPHIDVEHSIPLLKEFMENLIEVDRMLKYSNHTIGGPVQMVVLRSSKSIQIASCI